MPVESITGEIEALSMWSGQGIGIVDRVQPAAEIVRELAADADAVLARLSGA
jgi:nitronate monooxygenase